MIKQLTLFCMLSANFAASAQTAITINGSDIPAPTGVFNTKQITVTGTTTYGNNQNWNFGSYIGFSPDFIDYKIETDAFFTAQGIDVKQKFSKSFNANFSYNINYEFDYSSSGVFDKGFYVFPQAYELSNFTGNTSDSLKMAEQKSILTAPRKIMVFPMTANSAWKSISPRVSTFSLNIPSLSLNNTPCEHRFQIVRYDTIVGWGKLSVHTGSGVSAPIDVLVDRFEQYAIDSFFVNGAPASTQLKTAFGVSQGQITDKQYAYHFYRKGAPNYLLRLTYGTDNTFTNLAAAFINTDNLTTSDIKDLKDITYQSLMFPNPSNHNTLYVKLFGKSVTNPTYQIIDLNGKVLAEGSPELKEKELMILNLQAEIPNGVYFVKIQDNNTNIVTEQIQIQR